MQKWFASVLAAMLAVPGSATATIIAMDLYESGDGLVTRVEDAGLDVIDPIAFMGLPPEVLPIILADPALAGFHLANSAEACALMSGLIPSFGSGGCPLVLTSAPTLGDLTAVDLGESGTAVAFMDYTSITFTGEILTTAVFDSGDPLQVGGFQIFSGISTALAGVLIFDQDDAPVGFSIENSGYLLVREIPEPASGLLVELGLLCVALRRVQYQS